jgi:hypothetical protein
VSWSGGESSSERGVDGKTVGEGLKDEILFL